MTNDPKHASTTSTVPWGKVLCIALPFATVAISGLIAAWHRNNWDLEAAAMIGDSMAPFVGMFSVLALAVALWSARMQEREIQRQHQVYSAEVQRARNAELKAAYAPFMNSVDVYLAAVNEYASQMMRSRYRADRAHRDQFSEPCLRTYAEIDKHIQSLILADEDEARGKYRFQLSREIRLEPYGSDTPDKQRLQADIIAYECARRVQDFVALRDSLRREFGVKINERSQRAKKEADEIILSDLKAQADSARAQIKAELDAALKQRANVLRSPGRYSGEKGGAGDPSMELRVRVWNILDEEINEPDAEDIALLFVREVWRDILVRPADMLREPVHAWRELRELVLTCAPDVFYRIVEHAGALSDIRTKLGAALERSGSPYRFVEEKLVQDTGGP